MIVGAIQFRPPKGDVAAALAALHPLVRTAAQAGAAYIVCPEMCTTGYVWASARELRRHAEPVDGRTGQTLARWARALGVHLTAGFVEVDSGGRLYNAALTFDPQGALLSCYRKVCLFDLDRTWATAGVARDCVSTSFGRVVPGICMDINDDGFIHFLRGVRPSIVGFCTNWIEQGFDIVPYWTERLVGVGAVLVAANTWGREGEVTFCGRSAILASDGRRLAVGPTCGDAVVVAETGAGAATHPSAQCAC